MRVLVVDNYDLVRNSIVRFLRANNFEVVGEASDGLEALEKTRQLRPDVILMDIEIPRCNGLEATRLIKAEMPQTKIIILTGGDYDGDLFDVIKSKIDGYLLKPPRAEEFLTLLSDVAKKERVALEEGHRRS